MHKVLDINHYLQDGFYRIADVEPQLGNATKWNFINQHPDLYSEHRCWVYMIVDGNEVVKIGETGQPLGIRKIRDDQPQITTECRFGRLRGAGGKGRNMDGTYTDTDMRIREELQESVSRGTVSIYAKHCDERVIEDSIGGKPMSIVLKANKNMEVQIIAYMRFHARLPILNQSGK